MAKLRLEGKVALITGGASGIGEATARLFAEHGAAIVIADISTDFGCNVAASLPNASFIKCDVTDEEQVSTAVNFTVKTYGALHILFSNAGIMGTFSGILDMDLGSFDSVIAVNLRGVAATLKHGSRAMVDGGIRGSIICTGSVAGCLGGAASAAYTAAKHGLVGLVKAACAELGEYGIRVNCVSPFGVATPMVCAAFEVEPEEYEKRPLAVANLKGLTLKTNHIADTALFLASDESSYISGQNLMVDGGFSVVAHK